MAVFAVLLFIMANIGFEGGLVFYDAYLKEITSEKSIGRLSGYGFAMGYLGALCILLLLRPLLEGGISAANASNVQLSFLFSAVFFALFAAPIFLVFRDRKKRRRGDLFHCGNASFVAGGAPYGNPYHELPRSFPFSSRLFFL